MNKTRRCRAWMNLRWYHEITYERRILKGRFHHHDQWQSSYFQQCLPNRPGRYHRPIILYYYILYYIFIHDERFSIINANPVAFPTIYRKMMPNSTLNYYYRTGLVEHRIRGKMVSVRKKCHHIFKIREGSQ